MNSICIIALSSIFGACFISTCFILCYNECNHTNNNILPVSSDFIVITKECYESLKKEPELPEYTELCVPPNYNE